MEMYLVREIKKHIRPRKKKTNLVHRSGRTEILRRWFPNMTEEERAYDERGTDKAPWFSEELI